ncbi:MAG: CRTAC1 family protein [Candidatus Solibacter sp.]
MITRRQLLALPTLLLPALRQPAEAEQYRGMASRGVTGLPRGKPSGLPFHARFVNVAREAGLRDPIIYGDDRRADYILETMGCGVAFIDYDNDGWQDIVLLTGRRRHEPTPAGATLRLYHNNRDGTFKDITEKAGLGRSVWAAGITVADYDNDGFDDIFISCWGQNLLFHNEGNGAFKDVTEKAGLLHEGVRYGTGCTWLDYDRDGKLDLFVNHYVAFDPDKVPIRGKNASCVRNGVPVFCGPGGLPQERCRLYRNNGDGTFTDVSKESGVLNVKPNYPLTAVSADFDGDGWPDIYVACDTTPSLFLRNNRNGTFTERGLEAGVALNEDGKEQGGMGLGVGDFDNDGFLDIFKTHFSGDTNILLRNNGSGSFRDVTTRAGFAVETRFVGWGAAIQDLDNDGLPEVFFTTGMVYPEIEKNEPDQPYKSVPVLFRNLGGGRFEEILDQAGPAMNEAHSSRGAAFGDFDNDGDMDVLVMNINEPPSLLRNDLSGTGHWLKVLLEGVESNRSAIGAKVVATYGERKQAQAVMAQSSYLSVNDRRLHFGLGAETKAALEIRWPNGKTEKLTDIDADQLVVIREGAGIVRRQRFKA